MRAGNVACGYLIWYEDFSFGCSFCDCDGHVIDNCALLYPPKKDLKVRLLKHPKKKMLLEFLENANR